MNTRLPLDRSTLDFVTIEARRAHRKHSNESVLSPATLDLVKLAALLEELGEAASLFTPDQRRRHQHGWDVFVKAELVQVASVALSWVECLEGEPGRGELSDLTLESVQSAALRAYRGSTPISIAGTFTNKQRLMALSYAVGQVSKELWWIPKRDTDTGRNALVTALLNTAALALLWVQRLNDNNGGENRGE